MGDAPLENGESAMIHNELNISFDVHEAQKVVQEKARTSTTRDRSLLVDLAWDKLTFDVPAKKSKKPKLEPSPEDEDLHVPLVEDDQSPPGMRRVLHGVSGKVASGQVLAIMGASGSGKTTMLNLLSGRVKSGSNCKSGGHVYVNGAKRDFNTFRQVAKFVEQDDQTMFAELTVREQIAYAARLSLPSSMSHEHKMARVDRVIQELGLSKCQNTFVGSAIVRGVSGGERRRTSIGVELVTDPSLLFLDEPTTGLDSFNALNVMTTLRHLASNGRTIVTTIHQPRSSIFHLFDQLLLLAEGRIIYFGPAADAASYFTSRGFTVPVHFNVADYVIDLLSVDYRSGEKENMSKSRIEYFSTEEKQLIEPKIEQLVSENVDEGGHNRTNGVSDAQKTKITYPNHYFAEFGILARRSVHLVTRERAVNLMRLGQTLIFAVLLGLVWLNTGRNETPAQRRAVSGVLFFLVINQTFDAAFGIIFTFAAERAVITRERASGMYRTSTFFIAKQLVELPRSVFFVTLMIVIVYWMTGLRSSAGAFFFLILVATLLAVAGEGASQTVSVFAGDEQVAAAIVPVVIIINVLFGGFFIEPRALPAYLRWARYLSFVFYGYDAAAKNEFVPGGRNGLDDAILEALNQFSKWENVAFLFGFALLYKLLYFVALLARGPKFDRTI